jgi:hypothetical protein
MEGTMTPNIRFARRVFLGASIYGTIVMLPQYWLEDLIGKNTPPAITHPEHFYGFVGLALTWQLVFMLISRDVLRYRPLMVAAIFEKLAFGVPTFILYATGRTAGSVTVFAGIDLTLGVLFALSYFATRSSGDEALPSMARARVLR